MGAHVVTIIIAVVSAAIAAFSAWTARRSVRTARQSLAEMQRNNEVSQAVRDRDDAGRAFDDAMRLFKSLSEDSVLAPQRLEPLRDALRRSAVVAGMMNPLIEDLITADTPLPQERINEVKTYFLGRIAHWKLEIEQRQGLEGLIERGSA